MMSVTMRSHQMMEVGAIDLANLTPPSTDDGAAQTHPPLRSQPTSGKQPEYDRIKASIRTDGARSTADDHTAAWATDYIVHSGSNTRLDVLNSLYAETGDDRYATVACLFKPWRCESGGGCWRIARE